MKLLWFAPGLLLAMNKTPPWPRWRLFLYALLVPSLPVLGDDPIEAGRKSATEWIRLELEVARLAAAWDSQRGVLEASIQALEQRRDALRQQRDLLRARAATEARLAREADERNAAASAVVESTDRRLAELAARLRHLRPYLPPRLSAGLDAACRSIDDAKLPASERLSIAVSILNRSLQFDRSITFSEEVISTDSSVVMEVIYWGLGQACALDRGGGVAFIGHPGEGGWQWEKHPEIAPAVARLIDVHQEAAEPELVEVPARLADVPPAPAPEP